MNIYYPIISIPKLDWGTEKPRKYWSQPYNFIESYNFVMHHIIGPSNRFKSLTSFVPSSTVINPISPRLKLGFIGDIMIQRNREVIIDPGVKEFFADVDFLIGNFEGTIVNNTAKKVFMAQIHSEKILEAFSGFFPPQKTIFSCANNHAGDFGWHHFSNFYEKMKEKGFLMIGRKDEPSIVINNEVNIASYTQWSNQKCDYVAKFEDLDLMYNPEVKFNVLYPHWGHEMYLFPDPDRIALCKQLLTKWDLICGHHTHIPQPVTYYETGDMKKAVAYSLGNFSYSLNVRLNLSGIILKMEIGPLENGNWASGLLDYSFVRIDLKKRNTLRIVKSASNWYHN